MKAATMAFEEFRAAHPAYDQAVSFLKDTNEALYHSAQTVFAHHGTELNEPVREIMGFLEARGPAGYLQLYAERVRELQELQAGFHARPSQQTLCAPDVSVPRPAYDAALLLSFVFSDHRFAILQALREFLASLPRLDDPSRITAVGIGTGYELYQIARRWPDAIIEGFDVDPAARQTARTLLEYLHAHSPRLAGHFPLDAIEPEFVGTRDALILCEILEHLPDPLRALTHCREYLRPGTGLLFLTMAINIAQEDHIFWYPDLASCRDQLRAAGLSVVREWIAPITLFARSAPLAEQDFQLGNYIAVVRPESKTWEAPREPAS